MADTEQAGTGESIRITAPNGRYSIITAYRRDDVAGINHISCSAIQPWVVRNYSPSGEMAGGRTLTEQGRNAIIAGARQAGYSVEGD